MFDYLPDKRFLLTGVFNKRIKFDQILSEMEELKSLVDTYGGNTVAASYQKTFHPSFTTYFGKGKTQEIADKIAKEKIDIVVTKDILRPGQMYTLENIFKRLNPDIQVWDRIYLILHIFDLHAQSSPSKLQIKIASLKHMGPRIYGMGYVLSRQAGGIGTRGIGETNTEIMRRHWRTEIKSVKKKIAEMEKKHQLQIKRRRKLAIKSISIIGYTNSGKTTLFNLLTKKGKIADDKLFATLDSTLGKLYLPKEKKVCLLTDTIGFIRNLPPVLIDSFKSTLMESVTSDFLIHLIDVSDKEMELKIETVEKIISDLDLSDKKRVYVFNKIDKAKNINRKEILSKYKQFNPQFISAVKKRGIKKLLETISETIEI